MIMIPIELLNLVSAEEPLFYHKYPTKHPCQGCEATSGDLSAKLTSCCGQNQNQPLFPKAVNQNPKV
jgi:hypothetical protein